MRRIFQGTVFARMAAAGVVAAGLLSAGAAQAYDCGVVVFNDGWNRITAIHIVDEGSPDWGRNLLSHAVHAGDWTYVEPRWPYGCHFDVRFTYAGGERVTLWGVDLCGGREIVVDEWEAWVYHV